LTVIDSPPSAAVRTSALPEALRAHIRDDVTRLQRHAEVERNPIRSSSDGTRERPVHKELDAVHFGHIEETGRIRQVFVKRSGIANAGRRQTAASVTPDISQNDACGFALLSNHLAQAIWCVLCVKDCTRYGRITMSKSRDIQHCNGRARRVSGSTSHALAMVMMLTIVVPIVVVPITFGGVGIPMEAMNVGFSGPSLRRARMRRAVSVARSTLRPTTTSRQPPDELPMFTARAVREQFLAPETARRSLTIDIFKENYFREHVPYGATIFREARRYDLPPELVAAMVYTESDFRTKLVSRKSAQGLMEIVPSTARTLGILDPFDPEQNIAAGTKYFRYLLDRFGTETMALAAYNAGEGNVKRFGGIPPFPETRDYIVKVNRRTDRYRQRVHNMYLAALRPT
jgi:Transglycosylase SLT domain